MDDNKIIELYLSRDESAIRETQEKYGAKLRQTAYRILENHEAAEECENDTYLKAWNSIPPHEPRGYFFEFLVRIIKHEAIEEPKLPEGFNVLVKELQGLGLKVELRDGGETTDADTAIENISREIERAQDDRLIYDKHNPVADDNDVIDLTEDESRAALDEDGITITDAEGEEIAEPEDFGGTVDFGDEGEEL